MRCLAGYVASIKHYTKLTIILYYSTIALRAHLHARIYKCAVHCPHHNIVLSGALALGTTVLTNFPTCSDCISGISCYQLTNILDRSIHFWNSVRYYLANLGKTHVLLTYLHWK